MRSEKINHEPTFGSLHLSIAYMGTELSAPILNELPSHFYINQSDSLEQLSNHLDNQSILTLPDAILIEADPEGDCFSFVEKIKKNPLWRELIIVLIDPKKNREWKKRALKLKIHDYYIMPFPVEHLVERLNFLVKFKLIKPQLEVLKNADVVYKLPFIKRLFNFTLSAICILQVSPILIITAFLVRISNA